MKWFPLLVFVGLAVVGWNQRDFISGWLTERGVQLNSLAKFVKPVATPNPALEAVAHAKQSYPALALAGSAFNQRFVALYNEAKTANPDQLTRSNWPLQLATRAAKELGVAAAPAASQSTRRYSGWTDNYPQAVEIAKGENKKLLLDFTGSDWCGYCMALDKEVFNTAKFQTWAADNVELVRVDFPRQFPQNSQVKAQNAALKAKYPIDGFPTIVLVDTAGNVLGKKSGYDPGSGPDAFIATLQRSMGR